MSCSIYIITNSINKKVYVGQTWKTLEHRFNGHCIKQKDKRSKIFNAIKKYGKDNFNIECIAMCSDQETADYLEILYIKEYDSIKTGYNLRLGGSRGKHSSETIRKMSFAQMGEKNHRFGKKNSINHPLVEMAKDRQQSIINDYNNGITIENMKIKHKTSESSIYRILHRNNINIGIREASKKGKSWSLINGKRVYQKVG